MGKYVTFLIRWVLTSLGLWVVIRLFGQENEVALWQAIATFLLAGLIFAVINSILKPMITILSLPFVLVTLGLFMLIINGLMVWLTIALVPNLEMSFGWAIISGIVLSLVNYLVGEINEFASKEMKS
ncbi:MAG: phage holin family protein [Candidatus Nomurabacteria bacterium]|jgi:putative membrane protein|nr:phage holin family protein [Candidatus Nomurabacteria bacterium]